jgi:DNA-binding IclR family transcriptional regulator
MHVLSAQSLFGSGLIRRALPELEKLQETGMVVALGVLWRDQVCYLYHWEPGETAASALGRMNLYPASQSSIGRMLLSWQEEAHVRGLYADREIPLYPGPNGIEELLKDLRRAREQGYAYAVQNPEPLNSSLAVPVGRVPYAGIAVGGAVYPEEIVEAVARLRNSADLIEGE